MRGLGGPLRSHTQARTREETGWGGEEAVGLPASLWTPWEEACGLAAFLALSSSLFLSLSVPLLCCTLAITIAPLPLLQETVGLPSSHT